MSFPQILGLLFYGLVGLLFLGLLRVEIASWLRDRRNPVLRSRASRRLRRRGLGGSFLVLALILLKYPGSHGLSTILQILKLLICLTLCIAAILVTLWDFRVIRQEMKEDVEGFVKNSAQDLRRFLKKADLKSRRKPSS
jgi:cytochrome bd-type quinol oxidase subunit 2